MKKQMKKAAPANTGYGVLLELRLGAWWRRLRKRNPEAAKLFHPVLLPYHRPGTYYVAFYGSQLFNDSIVKPALRAVIIEWWSREYAEYPDTTLQAMQGIRRAIHQPQSKAEAVEIALLVWPDAANEKDDAIADRIEKVMSNHWRNHGKPITGEDVKKARQSLARKFVLVRSTSRQKVRGKKRD